MKIVLVVNPVSGGIDKKAFLEDVESICFNYNIDYEVYFTTGKDDENKLRNLLKNNSADKVAAIGGDGTILLCAKVLKDLNIPMGIVSMGSANGMAAELAINSDPIEAFKDILLTQYSVGVDLLMINKKYYSIHIGDVGINANIVKAYHNDENRGMATYVKYFLDEISNPKRIKFKLRINDKTIESDALMIAICNSRKYGSGFALNTIGSPFDGKFEIVLIENIDLNNLIIAGLSSLDEKLIDSHQGRTFSSTRAEIEFYEKQLLQLDGEIIGEFDKLSIEIIPKAVKLLLNRAMD